MGTRGFTTFVVDGVERTQYNHADSYPEALGLEVLHFLRSTLTPTEDDLEDASEEAVTGVLLVELTNAVRSLRLVMDDRDEVTPADVAALERYTCTSVGTPLRDGETPSWYQLLRGTMGDLAAIIDSGYLLENPDLPLDSLHGQWGYVIDLDDGDLEVYVGFQTEPHHVGRFADRLYHPDYRTTVYYPCRRVAAWPLDELPTDDEFLASVTPLTEDE